MESYLKRNALKNLLCIALAVIITAGFIPLPAQASTEKYNYKITTLSQKKWVTDKGDTYNPKTNTYTIHLYKITVPANSFIRIDTKSKDSELIIYKSFNKKKSLADNQVYAPLYETNIYRRVLPKGSYYIYAMGETFKWQCTTTKNPTNFCRTRSTPLKAGYKKTEVFNFGYEFDRWYRISLTARKPINVTMKEMDSTYDNNNYFSIYDSRGYKVSCDELNETNYRTAVLSKGTYYIRIYRSEYEDYYDLDARIYQFWWR